VTSSFAVKESKAVRRLQIGEVVEVLEAEKPEEATGLARCRCRALCDGKEGYVTLRGNQGTGFLEPCTKPLFVCEDEVQLQGGFQSSSAEVRRTRAGEVFELLEGPLKEAPLELQRLHGATKDGKSGWVTLKNAQGASVLEQTKVLVCKHGVALTNSFDIGDGSKPIRKLEVGEAVDIAGEEKVDEKRSMTRCQVRARSDGAEGWATRKGNQGTAYLEESDAHYVCKIAAPLEQRFQSGSALVKMLEVGDLVDVAQSGPKTETKEGARRLKGRSLLDGAVGWVNGPSEVTVPWAPTHRCKGSSTLTTGVDVSGAAVRKLEAGESLTALDVPDADRSTGLQRVRVRCDWDGACGYATVRSSTGAVFVEPVGAAAFAAVEPPSA